jgi:hypothetical protein
LETRQKRGESPVAFGFLFYISTVEVDLFLGKFKVFVFDRNWNILRNNSRRQWRHVEGVDNPADFRYSVYRDGCYLFNVRCYTYLFMDFRYRFLSVKVVWTDVLEPV